MIVWLVEGIGRWGKWRHYGPFDTQHEAEQYAAEQLLKAVTIKPKEVKA